MRNSIPTIFVVALLAALPVSAQTPKKSAAKPADDVMTLTGCVSGKPLISGEFTFVDSVTGSRYRLLGRNLKKLAGQQVELVSKPDKSFGIKGGLYPSPNVAAQAGALDPGQQAIASQPGGPSNGTAGSELPEFHVDRARVLPGSCK